MLSRIIGWLKRSPARPAARKNTAAARPRSATGHLFAKPARPPASKPGAASDADGGFNPYDTGKFDRSASWERISKTQR